MWHLLVLLLLPVTLIPTTTAAPILNAKAQDSLQSLLQDWIHILFEVSMLKPTLNIRSQISNQEIKKYDQ